VCEVIVFDSAGQLSASGENIKVYNWAAFTACSSGDRYGIAGSDQYRMGNCF
jgi:hypothetical protein